MITHNLQWLKKQSDNNLDKNKQMLKSFNAKVSLSLSLIRQAPASAMSPHPCSQRKMKAAIKTVIMSNHLMSAFGAKVIRACVRLCWHLPEPMGACRVACVLGR